MRTGELEEAVWARAEPTQPGSEAAAAPASGMTMATAATVGAGPSEEAAAGPEEAEVMATAAMVGLAASAAEAELRVQEVVLAPGA
jgi:hypothetical protein